MKKARNTEGNARLPSRVILARLLREIGRDRLPLLLSLLFSVAAAALTLYVPILIGRAINLAVGQGAVDFDGIARILAVLLVAVAATGLLRYAVELLNNRISCDTVKRLRVRAFGKIGRLPLSHLDRRGSGEIVSRIVSDVDTVSEGLVIGFGQLLTGVLTILGTLGFLFWLSPILALIVLLVTPLSLFGARFIAKRSHGYFLKQATLNGEETAFIDEMIGGQKVVQSLGAENSVNDRFDGINDRFGRAALSAVFFSSLVNPVTRFVNSVVYAAVALAGALLALSSAGSADPFTVGSLAAALAYATQYTKPFNEISGVVTELQNAMACLSRVFTFLDEEEEEPTEGGVTALDSVAGRFDFDAVDFSYLPDRPLLKNISLTVNPGEKVAIVGPTGCGKTTLINLLLRFYDVSRGAIRLDGTDLRKIDRGVLRREIGMVLQDSWIRGGSVAFNLAIGRPEATREEIEDAARRAHCDGFIRLLPEGYDTVLPEGGGNLSAGQKQLLSIARVMLCLPPILILDEATSSIDTRTERKIQDALAVLSEGRTSFIVAHRLSTVRDADLILVMRDGNVVETGKHEELLAKGGFYKTLYQSQFGSDGR